MTDEAILVQQLETRFFEATIAEGSLGTTILKGTVMVWDSDPNTVVASSVHDVPFAGILIADHKGGVGITRVALARHGVYAMKVDAGEAAVLGEPVKVEGVNVIAIAEDDTLEKQTRVVGIALETGAASEVIQVLVGGL